MLANISQTPSPSYIPRALIFATVDLFLPPEWQVHLHRIPELSQRFIYINDDVLCPPIHTHTLHSLIDVEFPARSVLLAYHHPVRTGHGGIALAHQ